MTPVLVGIAAYSTALRIDQYGLTPDRVWAVLLLSVAALYSIANSVGVILRRLGWMALIKPTNIWIALVIAVLALLSHTPVLDPLGLSARNQAQRLIRGRVGVDAFDFAFMQFKLGRPGRDWLRELASLEEHTEGDKIRERVRKAQSHKNYWEAESTQALLRAERVKTIPPLQSLPTGLFQEIASGHYGPVPHDCGREHCIYVYAVDLDADGSPEYCVLFTTASHTQRCLTYSDQGWSLIGEYLFAEGKSLPSDALIEALEAHGAAAEPPAPRFSDVRIGDSVFRLRR